MQCPLVSSAVRAVPPVLELDRLRVLPWPRVSAWFRECV